MPFLDYQFTTLRAAGLTEANFRDWITEKPGRLGLGPLTIQSVELQHNVRYGGRLDILAYRPDLDTYYEIELMLGEVDADHGFRCLDYWARERLQKPNAKHVAVLAAEDLSGRYKTLIDTLPNFLPFIAIELRALKLEGVGDGAAVVPFIVAQPDDLVIGFGDEPRDEIPEGGRILRDREWWESNASQAFLATVDALARLCVEKIGPSSVDYTANSYVSLKKGRRCWLPMWKRQVGVYVYLPGGPGGSEDSPSDFFGEVSSALNDMGVDEPSWTFRYNGGANPIGFNIPLEKVTHSRLLEILQKAYEFA